jgi:hypothetical protein
MKLLFPLLFLPLTLFSQELNDVYTGISLSHNDGNFAFVQWEQDIDLAFLRLEYLTNFNGDDRLYAKMSFRVFKYKNFRFYTGLPPFHYVHKEKGYNTPINFEVMFKRKLCLNIDVFLDNVNISVQFRHKF